MTTDLINKNVANDVVDESLDLISEVSKANGIVGVATLGGTLVTIGTGIVLIVKNRKKIGDKLDERRVRKLQKKGYEIYGPAVTVEDDESENEEPNEE